MNKRFIILILILVGFLETSRIQAAIFDVDMGKQNPPCGAAGAADIGFMDCTSNTGGITVTAMTAISVGDTVRWTMTAVPHTTTSEAGLTAGPPAACATG